MFIPVKESVDHFRPRRVADIYAAIDAMIADGTASTSNFCDVLEVSRSAYYAWRKATPSVRAQADAALSHRVQAIFWHHRRRYGTRRIAQELADQSVVCSPRRVAKLLKRQGLRAIQPKSFVPKTAGIVSVTVRIGWPKR